jgi:hypothetical protein
LPSASLFLKILSASLLLSTKERVSIINGKFPDLDALIRRLNLSYSFIGFPLES